MLLKIRLRIVGTLFLMKPPRVDSFIFPSMKPNFHKRGIFNWTFNLLSYHIWVHPFIFLNFLWIVGWVCRADTTKCFGRTWFHKFPMTISPKYTCDWCWISSILICSTFRKILLEPEPVSKNIATHPHPYVLVVPRKWYIMSLVSETEISKSQLPYLSHLLLENKIWDSVNIQYLCSLQMGQACS